MPEHQDANYQNITGTMITVTHCVPLDLSCISLRHIKKTEPSQTLCDYQQT